MHYISNFLILAAKVTKIDASGVSGGKGLSLSWAIVIFSMLLGLAITLSPTKRTYEVKRPKDEK
jgi:hypothetical protein